VKRKNDLNLYVNKDERRKLDANLVKCVFIGYCTDKKALEVHHKIELLPKGLVCIRKHERD
jgi:hypothetical protein